MYTISFTGHRPKDLPRGLDFNAFAAGLDALLKARTDLHFIAGGALGVDTWAAEYAILRSIPLTIITPFTPNVMTRFWSQQDRMTLERHIGAAVQAFSIGADFYNPSMYQRRNEAMVDRADCVFAVWTGKTHGGTWNCIQYALRKKTPVLNLLINGSITGRAVMLNRHEGA